MPDEDAIDRRRFLTHAASIGAATAGLPALVAHTPFAADAPRFVPDLRLGNDRVAGVWSTDGERLRALAFIDVATKRQLRVSPDVFALRLAEGGGVIRSSEMRLVGTPRIEPLVGDPRASRLAERLPGRQVVATLEDERQRLSVTWRAILRDESAYLRQEVELRALGAPLPIVEIALVDLDLPGAIVVGTVRGSPVASGDVWAGFEHPLTDSWVEGTRARCVQPRELPLRPGAPVVVSSVIGVARHNQMRRALLAYVERERAHPYRPFLHYNSWYDIGYFSKYDEAAALDVIQRFGHELVEKRGVVLSSYLFDDGWDDAASMWRFHAGFPRGFTPLREAAERFHAEPGVWLSPWGGYGKPKQERLARGREAGYETNEGGFALSGPKYYARFRETCLAMIRDYGVNQFKIDGTGNASRAIPGSTFDSDFDAAIALIAELRAAKPDLYVNLTTGTYPSPFWLRYADSIWRGGEDHDFAGVGTDRQRWITYRDADTYANVVRRGPLFPLNSLMLHGMIYARQAKRLDVDPHGDFTSEVRSYFATGTQLQEMYITPSLLGDAQWNEIAESAKWARANAEILVDSHWIGGDPAWLEPYGWAAWSPSAPTRATLTLRNPSDQPRTIAIDPARAFDLPFGATERWRAQSPYRDRSSRAPIELRAGAPREIGLAPFEVLVLDAISVRA